MTNYERIKKMTIEEMAENMNNANLVNLISTICKKECEIQGGDPYECAYYSGYVDECNYCTDDDTQMPCVECIKRWLESETEE